MQFWKVALHPRNLRQHARADPRQQMIASGGAQLAVAESKPRRNLPDIYVIRRNGVTGCGDRRGGAYVGLYAPILPAACAVQRQFDKLISPIPVCGIITTPAASFVRCTGNPRLIRQAGCAQRGAQRSPIDTCKSVVTCRKKRGRMPWQKKDRRSYSVFSGKRKVALRCATSLMYRAPPFVDLRQLEEEGRLTRTPWRAVLRTRAELRT